MSKRRTIIYSVQDDDADGGFVYYPTLAALRADFGHAVDYKRHVVAGHVSRDLACRLLNHTALAVPDEEDAP